MSQRHERVDFRRTPRRDVAGQQRYHQQAHHDQLDKWSVAELKIDVQCGTKSSYACWRRAAVILSGPIDINDDLPLRIDQPHDRESPLQRDLNAGRKSISAPRIKPTVVERLS